MAKSSTKRSGGKAANSEKMLRSSIARIKKAISSSSDTASKEHRQLRKRLKRAQRKLNIQRVMIARTQKTEGGAAEGASE